MYGVNQNGAAHGYMNRFLDFTVDMWQQQKRTTESLQQCLHDNADYVNQQLDEKTDEENVCKSKRKRTAD